MTSSEVRTSSESISDLLQDDGFSTHRGRTVRTDAGFTIVELLITIVVVAILAAITIVAYNGITGRAWEVSLKSDLRSGSTVVELDNQRNGSYPGSAGAANEGQGLKASGDNTLTYMLKPYGFCIAASNPAAPSTFVFKSISGQIVTGNCEVFVSTLAGAPGVYDYVDGAGTAARFSWPEGIVVDDSGTVYVADFGNDRIRKITPNGAVTTFANLATAAAYIALDSTGNVYVSSYSCVQKIAPSATVSTLAGTCGSSGYVDGNGTTARFSGAKGLDVDSSGNVYVADTDNQRIRKIAPDGTVTTLAGSGVIGYLDGGGPNARFSNPTGVAVDGSGTVYVADATNNCIRRISPAANVSTFAGGCGVSGYADGTGVTARFSSPHQLDVDSSGALYITDYQNRRIRAVSPSGVVTTVAGTGAIGSANGSGASAQFSSDPRGIGVAPDGTIYVADSDNCLIRKITQ